MSFKNDMKDIEDMSFDELNELSQGELETLYKSDVLEAKRDSHLAALEAKRDSHLVALEEIASKQAALLGIEHESIYDMKSPTDEPLSPPKELLNRFASHANPIMASINELSINVVELDRKVEDHTATRSSLSARMTSDDFELKKLKTTAPNMFQNLVTLGQFRKDIRRDINLLERSQENHQKEEIELSKLLARDKKYLQEAKTNLLAFEGDLIMSVSRFTTDLSSTVSFDLEKLQTVTELLKNNKSMSNELKEVINQDFEERSTTIYSQSEWDHYVTFSQPLKDALNHSKVEDLKPKHKFSEVSINKSVIEKDSKLKKSNKH